MTDPAPVVNSPPAQARSLPAGEAQRLALLKFPLIVLVVMIHAYDPVVGLQDQAVGYLGGAVSQWLRFFVSQGLGRVAVPLFFLMAGYFFFLGWNGRAAGLHQRWRSRVHSLLIPFLFWNTVAMLVLWLVQELPWFSAYLTGQKARVAGLSWYGWFNTLVGLEQRPAAYQFWFIRDLMVLVLLAPLWRPVLARPVWAWRLLAALALLWCLNWQPLLFPAVEATLFFCTGAWAATVGRSLFALDRFAGAAGVMFLLAMAAFASMAWTPEQHTGVLALFRAALILGAVAVLGLSARLPASGPGVQRLLALGTASFFVFAVHEPLLSVLRKLAFSLLRPSSEAAILALYLTLPALTVLLALLAYGALHRVSPGLLSWVSGGRNRKLPPAIPPSPTSSTKPTTTPPKATT